MKTRRRKMILKAIRGWLGLPCKTRLPQHSQLLASFSGHSQILPQVWEWPGNKATQLPHHNFVPPHNIISEHKAYEPLCEKECQTSVPILC